MIGYITFTDGVTMSYCGFYALNVVLFLVLHLKIGHT